MSALHFRHRGWMACERLTYTYFCQLSSYIFQSDCYVAGATIAVTLLIYYLQYHLLYPDDFYTISFSFFLVLVGGGLFLAVALVLALFSVSVKLRYPQHSPS